MEDSTLDVLKWAVGIFLILLAGIGSYVLILHKQNKKDRADNREERKEYMEIIDEGRKESNIVVKENTGQIQKYGEITSALKTLLEQDIWQRNK